ncbi:hypothetical protein LTR85_009061 [Meristemomyces frigidus]|nr:hypothetical protein LTR85_009061 [Meristemomyces frigidus]
MASILAVLPPELLSRIISFLSEQRKDISACRLVCRTLKELSSPYLITRVVFAKRFDAVSRLQDVLQHPYFSRYVTELVYDASLYDPEIAGDWNEYVQQCQEAPRNFVDLDWAKRRRTEAQLWHQFAAYSDPPLPTVPSSMNMLMADTDNAIPNVQSMGQHVLDQEPQSRVGEDGAVSVDDDFYEEDEEDYYEQVYRLGCHKGFPDYYLRHKTQRCMQEAKLPLNMLQHILARLPKLRTIHFTDYRSLCRNRESYDQCCSRLFGNTLEPDHMSASEECWKALIPVLNAVAVHPTARIEELRLAATPYVQTIGECLCEIEIVEPRVPATLPLTLFGDMGELGMRNMAHVFSNLRRLDLPFVFGEVTEPDFAELFEDGADCLAEVLLPLRTLLDTAAPNLTHLTLSVHGLAEHREDANGRLVPYKDDAAHVPFEGASQVFDMLLSPITFPRLQFLELAGWVFHTADLQKFLSRHQSSLAEFRLLNNFMIGNSEDLARWAGMNLCLGGVRITNWVDVVAPDLEANIRHTRRTRQVLKPGNVDKLPGKDVEALWLAGRSDQTTKISDAFEDDGSPWYMQEQIPRG